MCRNTALLKRAIARSREQQTLEGCCRYKTHVASARQHCRRADLIPASRKTKQSALLFDHRRRICTVELQVAQVDQVRAGRDARASRERRTKLPLPPLKTGCGTQSDRLHSMRRVALVSRSRTVKGRVQSCMMLLRSR